MSALFNAIQVQMQCRRDKEGLGLEFHSLIYLSPSDIPGHICEPNHLLTLRLFSVLTRQSLYPRCLDFNANVTKLTMPHKLILEGILLPILQLTFQLLT